MSTCLLKRSHKPHTTILLSTALLFSVCIPPLCFFLLSFAGDMLPKHILASSILSSVCVVSKFQFQRSIYGIDYKNMFEFPELNWKYETNYTSIFQVLATQKICIILKCLSLLFIHSKVTPGNLNLFENCGTINNNAKRQQRQCMQ